MTRPVRMYGAPCALALFLALPGCATDSSWDGRFGDAVRQLQVQQQLDAQAAQRQGTAQRPVDGRTVREARDRYLETFAAPPAVSVINIGLGAGTGTAK